MVKNQSQKNRKVSKYLRRVSKLKISKVKAVIIEGAALNKKTMRTKHRKNNKQRSL